MSFFSPDEPRKYYARRPRGQRLASGAKQALREVPLVLASVACFVLALTALPLCLLMLPFRDKPGAGILHTIQQGLAGLVFGGMAMLLMNPASSYFRVKRAAE